jgi:DNA polymerase-3 subunit delta
VPDKILSQLQKGVYAPVYFLQGDEPFYIDQISSFIEKNALPEHEKAFNQVVLYGKDADVSAVLMQARRFPMMADRQVVIVKEAQSLADIEKDKGREQLLQYLEKPLPSTVLVFCYKNKTLDSRTKVGKALATKAVLLTTKKLYDSQVPAWINSYAKGKQLSVTPKAVAMLAEYIGSDLSRLAMELEKLTLNVKQLIQEHVGISKDYNVFELQSALVAQDVLKVHRILAHFESNPKNNPIFPNLTMLFGFFSKLLVLQTTADRSEETWKKIGVFNSFSKQQYQQAIRTFSGGHCLAIIHHLRTADLQSKGIEGGGMSEADIMRELVYKIMHGLPKESAEELQRAATGYPLGR